MGKLFYKLGLKIVRLLRLDPEKIHNFTLKLLSMGLGPKLSKFYNKIAMPLFGGRHVTPIGLSAGMDKNGIALHAWSDMGFGFVEVGTVTYSPRSGNTGVRIWRGDNNDLFNFMGLNNLGYCAVKENLSSFKRSVKSRNFKVGMSLMSLDGSRDELSEMTANFYPLVDYFSVNVACPNVEHKRPFIEDAKEQLVPVIQNAHYKPVLLKLPPIEDEAELRSIVTDVLKLGVKGFIATNTQAWNGHYKMLGRNLNDIWPKTDDGDCKGGYSGPLLLPITINMVRIIREVAGDDIIIIGVGGIQSGADAKDVMDAGADAVQILTGLVYKGPYLPTEIAETLSSI